MRLFNHTCMYQFRWSNLFRNLFKPWKVLYSGTGESRHLKRIKSGEKIVIDGKVFAKVKLRFVDTLDFNTTRFVNRLETEIESQKSEIERLTSLLADNEKLINDLQSLNANLLHDNRTQPSRLNERIETLAAESKERGMKVADLMDECSKLKEKINLLNAQTIKSQNLITEKDKTIKSLEQSIYWFKASDKGIKSLVDSKSKLKKELRSTQSQFKVLANECDKRDSMIQFLTKKIRDYELKIYDLESKNIERDKKV
jgi:chromosome segregation ATPase